MVLKLQTFAYFVYDASCTVSRSLGPFLLSFYLDAFLFDLTLSITSISPQFDSVRLRLRPRLYGENLSQVERSPAYPSYPGRANFSYMSLQNLANRLHEKQKVGSARRVTRLAGLPFCDGINTLARLAGSTGLRRDD